MKNLKTKIALNLTLTAALLITMLSVRTVLVRVGAEGDDVSASAKPTVSATENVLTVKIGASESEKEKNVFSIKGKTRVSTRLYAGASPVAYNGSYGGELTSDSVARQVYDGFYANYVTTPGNSSFTVTLNPPVTVKGVDNGRLDNQGNTVIDPDTNDPDYVDFLNSISRGSTAFSFDHPEVYWIRDYSYQNYFSYGTNANGDYEVELTSLSIYPSESYSGAYSQRDTVNNGIASAKNAIPSGETRYDTLKNIHDYICTHADYDDAAASQNVASEAHTAAPLFNGKGKFVCEGYSKSLKILCDQFDIPCALVSGTGYTGSSNEPHMWAYVQMDDGKWYAVDNTWDDQSSGIIYNYFLKGSNTMSSDHTPSPPAVNGKDVDIYYPSLAMDDYDPDWNQGQEEPVSSEPVSSEPVTSEPVTSEPVTSEPVTSEPVTSEPVTSEPVTSEPVTSEPVTSEPVTSEPVTSEPVTSDPVTSEPVTSEPVTSEPVTSEPVTSEPVTSEPVTSEPVTSEPVTSEPVTSEPVTSEPVTSEPVSSDTSSDDTSSDDTTDFIELQLDDPDNGFVKSARITKDATAKADGNDVEIAKIKVVITKLEDTKNKAMSDGIKKISNGFDPVKWNFIAYDISLVDSNNNKVKITKGSVSICLAFPSTLTKKYTNYVYAVYHQKDDGAVECVKSTRYNAQGVWFEGDDFSPYALTAVEKSGGEPSPGTGETILLTVVAIILLGLAAGGIVFAVIKNKSSDDSGFEDEPSETDGTDSDE